MDYLFFRSSAAETDVDLSKAMADDAACSGSIMIAWGQCE
jgi:hypothetical protein